MADTVEIAASLAGERLDRVVALLTDCSRAKATSLIRNGGVTLDGSVATAPSTRVAAASKITIDRPIDLQEGRNDIIPSSSVNFDVVYEDAAIVIVDKPAGVVVHPGAGHRDDTLVSGLLARYPDFADWNVEGSDPMRPGIVHRLDKDTSGLLVVARTEVSYRHLVEQLRDRSMGREYTSLVVGHLGASAGTIEAPIGRSDRTPTLMAVTVKGKPATTDYRVFERYVSPFAASLVEAHLQTGRTHQIRVHFGAIGHPVVGDSRYGGVRSEVSIKRPFLHAARLVLHHPTTGEEMEFTAALPGELLAVLDQFSVEW